MCDCILYNARAITMDPACPFAELIAIDKGKITAVSANAMLRQLRSSRTQVLDCGGKTLLPGFVDAHCHLHAYAESLLSLKLSPREGITSIIDIQNSLREAVLKQAAGTWIRGKSYDDFYLAEKRHPNRSDLDAAAPFNPVKLTHRSGHAHVLNSLALKLVGIEDTSGDPPGGFIDRDPSTGSPTGILYGLGPFLAKRIPRLDDLEMLQGVKRANEKLLSYGITSFQDASSNNGPETWKRFEDWKSKQVLHPRIVMMTGLHAFRLQPHPPACGSVIDRHELRPGGIKIIADEVTGSLHPSQDDLNEAVSAIHTAGLQAAIHAIEPAVIEAAAKAIEFALFRQPRKDHRHRIEHCSLCPPHLQKQLAAIGIMVITQPSFIYYSGDRYLQTVPAEQIEDLYPSRELLANGVQVGAGSDFPISDPNPLVSIGAAVTRETETGQALPPQCVDIFEALKMHTVGAAAAAFEDTVKGTLSPGKLADIVMLSENPFETEPPRIKDIRVVMTMIGGKQVYIDRC